MTKWGKKRKRESEVGGCMSPCDALALIGELEKEWCSSIHPSTGCASPRPNETIIEDDRKQGGNMAFIDTLTGPSRSPITVSVLLSLCLQPLYAALWGKISDVVNRRAGMYN